MTLVFTGNAVAAVKGAANPQKVTPTTGQTVSMTAGTGDAVLYLTPASSLLSLTVTLPDVPIGNTVYITSTQNIVSLNVNGGTVLNGLSSLSANGTVAFLKVDANTYSRVAT